MIGYIKKLILSTIVLVGLVSCGGGDTSSDIEIDKNTTKELVSYSSTIRSVIVNRDTATDPYVSNECGTLGGIAIYTGIDSNGNGVLDTSEQNPTPKVVCNGASSADVVMKQLDIGDDNCPNGGVSLQIGSQTSYVCSAALSNTEPVSSTFTSKSTIRGSIKLDNVYQRSITRDLRSSVNTRVVTSMNGGLWLTPAAIQAAINEDIKVHEESSTVTIPTPIVKPIKVPIKSDNSYVVPDVPSGEYSLVYIDSDTNDGTKIDNIVVKPGEDKVQDISSVKAMGDVKFKIASLNGEELSNAIIRLNELDINTTSEVNGTAGFTDLPEGSYSLSVSYAGYVSKYISFNITSDQTTDLQTIELNSKKGKLVGKVSANLVDDLANIIVYAKASDGSIYTTLTNNSGNYIFNALPVSDGYSVLAMAHDFESSKVDNINIQESLTSIASEIVLKKEATTVGNITGFARFADVTNSLNHAGIIVSIEGTDKEAISSRDGSFILNNIEEGTYTLNFTDSNHVTQTKEVQVIAGSTTTLTDIELIAKVGSLTGKVVDEKGTNVKNAYITVLTSSQTLTAITDDNGEYLISGILAGIHEVIVAKDGYGAGSKIITILQSQTTDAKTNPIIISRKLFTGKVNLQNTTDNSGVTISLVGTDISSVQTDSSGNFTIYGVGAGNYQLQISKAGYVTQTIPLTITSDDGYSMPYNIELLQSKSIIEGVATLSNKISSSGIKVEILGTNYFTYTDATGKWAVNVSVGNYSDGIKYSKDLFSQTIITDTATVVENGSFNVGSISLTQIYQNFLGKVTVSGKTDYENCQINITGISGNAKGTTSSINASSDGTFIIQNLPLGEYTYTINYPDGLHESLIGTFILDGSIDSYDLGTTNLRTSYLTINNNNTYTNSRIVTLQIGNSDAVFMQIVEGGITYEKENLVSSKDINLSDGDGEKTVEIKLYDINNNPLPSIKDTIILDTNLTVSNFILSGASKKGDILRISLSLEELGANVYISISSIVDNLKLLDNGTGGDTTANDGIYERTITIQTPQELDLIASANIIDIAGNTNTIATSNKLSISTPPSIENIKVSSNIKAQTMSISFTTDEPTTSYIQYGTDTEYGSDANISATLSTNHSITLSNLVANTLTYFKIIVKDESKNISYFASQGKLAPPAPINIAIQAGDNEIGLVWDKVDTQGVIGYNLYRSDNNNTFIKVNDTVITDIYYLDTLAFNDTTYLYKLTAVDENNNESVQSQIISTTPLSSFAGPTQINGGIIDTNTIWLSSRSPYNITSNMKIKKDTTLILLAGTTINLSGDERLMLIEGKLIANGTALNNIVINATNFTISSDPYNTKAGYISLDGDNIVLNYVNIDNTGFIKTNGDIILNNSIITLNTCASNKYFNISQLNDSNLTEEKGLINNNCVGRDIKISHINNSILTHSGDNNISNNFIYSFQRGISINTETIKDSNFTNGTIYFNSGIENSFIDNSILKNVYISGGMSSITIQNSNIDKAYIIQGSIILHYNILTNIYGIGNYDGADSKWLEGNMNISHNYWGTTNLETIMNITHYTPTDTSDSYTRILYPIISTSDFYTADFDNDGILDIIDNDNDNDGYSDLQEDKESDPEFGSIYNPLDKNSHPNSDFDNDFDSVIDSIDDDDDNDGLSDTDEETYGTNSMIVDSDGDGVDDNYEISYKYDPLNKDNYPIIGSQSGINIGSSNVNSDGIVYILGNDTSDITYSTILTNITIEPGTKINIEKDRRVTIKDSNIIGTKTNPIIVRSNGAGTGILSIDNSNISYANIKIALRIELQNNSKIEFSDISFNEGDIDSSSIVTDSFINGTNNSWANYGTIKNSYIISSSEIYNSNKAIIESSYIKLSNASLYNYYGATIKSSYVNYLYLSGYSGSNSKVENSVIDEVNANSSDHSNILNSDIKMYSNGTQNIFFDGVYLGKDGSDEIYSGLGIPEDQIGDGVAETEFTIDGTTYKVDGIVNPRDTKNYLDWTNNPAVKQYFWDPTNVGCLWDKNNPDTFPE